MKKYLSLFLSFLMLMTVFVPLNSFNANAYISNVTYVPGSFIINTVYDWNSAELSDMIAKLPQHTVEESPSPKEGEHTYYVNLADVADHYAAYDVLSSCDKIDFYVNVVASFPEYPDRTVGYMSVGEFIVYASSEWESEAMKPLRDALPAHIAYSEGSGTNSTTGEVTYYYIIVLEDQKQHEIAFRTLSNSELVKEFACYWKEFINIEDAKYADKELILESTEALDFPDTLDMVATLIYEEAARGNQSPLYVYRLVFLSNEARDAKLANYLENGDKIYYNYTYNPGVNNVIETTPIEMKGDADGDGFISSSDCIMLQTYIAGVLQLSPTQIARADVTDDGMVTASDYTTLALMLRS